MTIFVRKLQFTGSGVQTSVFGPYADRKQATDAILCWSESMSIPLDTGLPFPDPDFWADGGSLSFYIEPGQGTPASNVIE